jgi:ribonuclease P protein component
MTVKLARLKVRREFLYAAQGWSERRRLVVIQGRARPEPRPEAGLGFTATKKVGNSVVRNRARRRLREAARLLLPSLGVSGTDYVFIARQETGTGLWPRLLDDVESALLSLRGRLTDGDPQRPRAKDQPAKDRPATRG